LGHPMKKILILGGAGMLGHSLMLHLGTFIEAEVYCTLRKKNSIPDPYYRRIRDNILGEFDINDLTGLFDSRRINDFSVVVNCIGIIKQLPESKDPVKAISTNALFPHKLSGFCRAAGIRLIHISTDCVFDGLKGTYTEEDNCTAKDLYGMTKYLGELHDNNTVTLRSSIIGHELKGKHGLVEWFLGQEGPVLGFTKAVYSGFPTIEFARMIATAVIPNENLTGLYHISSDPITKYNLLKIIAARYNKKTEIVSDDQFVCDRSLNSDRFKAQTGYKPPPWTEMVDAMHREYVKNREIYQS
jgi:dTDP-4-dehydrorhamnose reductase